MAHSPKKKSEALALLVGGSPVGYVAAMTAIPKQTISRWRNRDLEVLRADRLRASATLRAVAVAIAEAGLASVAPRKKRRKRMGQAHR